MAVEACRENLDNVRATAALNGWSSLIEYREEWIGEESRPLRLEGEIALAKIDIEGAEEYAIRWLRRPLTERRIGALLVEISPCFNDSYTGVMRDIMKHGYDAYVIPAKPGPETRAAFEDDPWAALRAFPVPPDINTWIKGIHQENVMFVRHG